MPYLQNSNVKLGINLINLVYLLLKVKNVIIMTIPKHGFILQEGPLIFLFEFLSLSEIKIESEYYNKLKTYFHIKTSYRKFL